MTDALYDRLRESLGGNVARLRSKRAMTQEDLAHATGLDVRYLQRIERGRVNVSLKGLAALARALGVEPRALLRPAKVRPARPGRPSARRAAARGDAPRR